MQFIADLCCCFTDFLLFVTTLLLVWQSTSSSVTFVKRTFMTMEAFTKHIGTINKTNFGYSVHAAGYYFLEEHGLYNRNSDTSQLR